ncbi:hypothetical protein [Streptomyces mirabilis]|uniref:hypothetical protein n=1 Tax=Streptomyces mirabilis TaxID=68239 RepID=UPI0036DDD815
MLLRHFGPAREDDVHTAWRDPRDPCTEEAHQSLPVETRPDARLYLGARLFPLRLLFHVFSFGGHHGVERGRAGSSAGQAFHQ